MSDAKERIAAVLAKLEATKQRLAEIEEALDEATNDLTEIGEDDDGDSDV